MASATEKEKVSTTKKLSTPTMASALEEVATLEKTAELKKVAIEMQTTAPKNRHALGGVSENVFGRLGGNKEVVGGKVIVGDKEVLIIGDSIVKHIRENVRDRVEVRAYPGIRIQSMKGVINKLNPDSVKERGLIIHVGTNDVSERNRMGKIRFVREMEDLVRIAIDRFGASRVAVSGLLYRADMMTEVIDTFNFFLLRMCERVGVCFVDGNCWLEGYVLARDGLHLNRWGSKQLGTLLGRVGENLITRL
jgi:hypothetical protein